MAGKPLLQWTIEAVKECRNIDKYVVSSESADIRALAVKLGADTHSRDSRMAQPDTPSVKAMQDVLRMKDPRGEYGLIALVPCTSPLKTSTDIEGAIEIMKMYDFDSVIGVSPSEPAERIKTLRDGAFITDTYSEPVDGISQKLPKYWVRNGSVYVVKRKHIEDGKLFGHERSFAMLMPRERGINIDDMLDWKLAEVLLREREGL